MTDDDVNFDFPRDVALHNVENLGRFQDVLVEQHASMFKWLLASLLAINGGGVIAVMNATNLALAWKLGAACAFCLGIFAAMISGQLGQKFIVKSLGPVSAQRGFWLAVSQTGIYDPVADNQFAVERKNSNKLAWTVSATGWVSAALFAAGAICVGLAIANGPSAERVRQECQRFAGASAS